MATFAAGAMAVGAAITVGRQQAAILKNQTKLQVQSLKIELLERRADIIKRYRVIHSNYWRDADLGDEDWRKLATVLQDAELIFSEEISGEISKLLNAILRSKFNNRVAMESKEVGDRDAARERIEKSIEYDDIAFEVVKQLLSRLVAEARVTIDE